MKFTFTLTLILFGLIQNSESCGKNTMRNSDDSNRTIPLATKGKSEYERLPENIKTETQVRRSIKNDKGEIVSYEVTTVGNRLDELEARYENSKLVDKSGKEIRFFEPLCRGVSRGVEEDEEDRKAKENELSQLEKTHTVIVLYCDPRKVM